MDNQYLQLGAFLGASADLNATILLDVYNSAPTLAGFDSITFGTDDGTTSSMTISAVWGQEKIYQDGEWVYMTKEYLDNYNNNLQWTEYTYLMTLYSNNLDGGSINDLGSITQWSLYRMDNVTNRAKLIDNFDASVQQYIDYTGLLGREYTYLLYAFNSDGQMSSALKTATVQLNYYGYFLIDVDNDVVYKFDTNFSGGDLKQTTDYASFRTNNKYMTYHTGELQYLSGNIAALVRYANSNIYINNTTGLLENLRDCIKDDNRTKILKTRKGEGWYVFTYDYNDSVINQAIGAQPVNASFSFDEIGTLDGGIDSSAFNVVY